MNAAQKVIKAFAICLASLIILGMISAVIGVISLISVFVGVDYGFGGDTGPMTSIWQDSEKVQNLSIETGATDLKIVETADAKEIQVETNNDKITSERKGDTLEIKEDSGWWVFDRHRELIVRIPQGYKFDNVRIDAGAGTVSIETLQTADVRLELGAGKTSANRLIATNSAQIDGGAGVIEILDGKLHDLDLEIGAGKADITAAITGNSKIESGAGRLELSLTGAEKDYRFTIDKGIGTVTINGNSMHDDEVYGDGNNTIKIESGVGSVEVKTLAR